MPKQYEKVSEFAVREFEEIVPQPVVEERIIDIQQLIARKAFLEDEKIRLKREFNTSLEALDTQLQEAEADITLAKANGASDVVEPEPVIEP